VGSDSAALLLRLRAELASDAPELLGACYSSVLALEGLAAIPWAAQFLPPEDDAAAEAAIAIAQTHTSEAFKLLSAVFAKARDPWFRTAVLSAPALTRQQQATDWLLDLIANEQSHAADAQEALCRTAPSVATLDRLKQLGRPCKEDVEEIDPVRDVARPSEMGNVVEDVPPVNLFEILLRTNRGEGVQGASVGIQGLPGLTGGSVGQVFCDGLAEVRLGAGKGTGSGVASSGRISSGTARPRIERDR
jgi:hypothetical protein